MSSTRLISQPPSTTDSRWTNCPARKTRAHLPPTPLLPPWFAEVQRRHAWPDRPTRPRLPLLFSRADQVNAILPFELTDRLHESLPVLVRRGLTVSTSELMLISGARPGAFTQNQSGGGPGAVVDLGGAKANEANPVSAEDAISLFATGLG